MSAWISNIKEKWGGLHFVFNALLKQSSAVMPAFFRKSDKKRGEMEREGSWRMGGGKEEMEGLLTCTCLQSLRIHCTIHLLCLYCHGWGPSDQTPIRFLILPPYAQPSFNGPPPHPHPRPQTPFFHVTCWLKERQGNSQASPNGEMSGREPISKPCCHGDTVRSRNYRLTHRHSIHTQAFMLTQINTLVYGFF